MRRKTKANASSESPEKAPATRRSTRRGRASPVEQVIEYKETDEESSSDNEEEYSPRKTRRPTGRRGARSKASSGSDREVKTPKTRGRRGAARKVEEPLVEEEEATEEEPQREPEPQVQEEQEVAETILPDETNDEADQENGGEKVSIEIVPADPEPHVTEDSESGFPQRTSSPEPEHIGLIDDDVHMKTLSPEQPRETVQEAQSPQSEHLEEKEEERRPETPQEEDDEKQDEMSKRSSSPEEGELPDQRDSADEQSKESPENNHSKSEDEEPITKSPVKEVKVPEVVFVGKLTRNDGKAHMDEQAKKKRRWMSRKPAGQSILAISTDSLKPLFADVKPVPLVEVKLDLTSDNEADRDDEEDNGSEEEGALSPKEKKDAPIVVEKVSDPVEMVRVSTEVPHPIGMNRKILLVNEDMGKTAKPPSPPKNTSSCILFITNLVRPFTVLQLKGLLVRTGKIVDNGFWIDKIKSKCYVQYETEDQAVETRHALHGVRWPTSNPKCLHVDFGSETDMQKAIESTADDLAKHSDASRGERIVVGWERDRIDGGAREQTSRPIREWDVGKKDEREKEKERTDLRGRRERSREREEVKRSSEGTFGRDRRRTLSASPARKFKKENEPPIRLLDDLFRKTKATPSIYWLPLTAEQIAVKEEARKKNLQEHQKRMDEMRKERNRERDRERDRDRDRTERSRRDRSRSRDRRYR
uniref:Putative apoptotic chromatin condensation inducer in the nucleus n=1 Tax=Phlebotomus kandelakii TaxID=1109342 RepID=A0A6B2E5U1_9DIPT